MYILTFVSLTGDEENYPVATSESVEKLIQHAEEEYGQIKYKWEKNVNGNTYGVVDESETWYAGDVACRIEKVEHI